MNDFNIKNTQKVSISINLLISSFNLSACDKPLGMESGAIKDGQLRASTEYTSNHGAKYARLNKNQGAGCWASKTKDQNQWLQVGFSSPVKVTGVATQGRTLYSQWVTKYKLQYSDDGENFQYYKEEGKDKVKRLNKR